MKLANGNYIRPTAKYSWWLRQTRYWQYMIRELSSFFIYFFSLVLVWGLFRLSQGEDQFTSWILQLWESFNGLLILTFLFAFYHSYTWFKVTPKAMAIKFRGKRIAAWIIIGAHLLLWLICSLFMWYVFVLGGNK